MGDRIALIIVLYVLWAGVVLSLEAWVVRRQRRKMGEK